MATTTSKYVTKNDLSTYSKTILSLLSQRDTKINTNTNDIDALKLAIENIDASLHYMGDVQTLPTTADDGALYQVAGSLTTAVVDGWYFYSVDSTAWKNLSTGGGTDLSSVHYKGIATALPAAPAENDLYYFNITDGYKGYYLYTANGWTLVTDAHYHTNYTDTEVEDFFDVTPEEASELVSIIQDTKISKNLLWSSDKTNSAISGAITTAEKYADNLVKNISSVNLKVVTALPSTATSNTIYILKGTNQNVLYVYSENAWVNVGDFDFTLEGYVTTADLNTKLADYVKITEALTVDDFEDDPINFDNV